MKNQILRKKDFLTPLTVKSFVNEYLQHKVLDLGHKEDTQIKYDFVLELDELYNNGQMASALQRYGIPIVASYLHFIKDHSLEKIITGIKSIKNLSKVMRSSIIRSPYIQDMKLLNWRDIIKDQTKDLCNENWWRDVDYAGVPLESYRKLCRKE